MFNVEYRNRSVSSADRFSVKDKIVVVSFRNKGKRAIAASEAGLGAKQTPSARRGGVFPAVIAFTSVVAIGVVVWAPISRAHLMVSLVAGMASLFTAAGFGSHPHE